MKTIKRTLAVLLTMLMLISAVPLGVMNVSAADSPVKTILDKVESVYSAGTYFTANRKACNHSSGTTCNNCKLATILDSADCKTIKRYSNGTYNANTWTCFSFVSFCFTQCFGKSYVSSNYNKTIDSNDLFSTRTDFTNQSVAIKKEFFSHGKIGDIIKCFRYAKGDDGQYHYYHKHSMVFISADSTGVTVFDANVNGNDSHTGVVRKAKIKYENIKHYNIEILHAKNYNDVVGYTTVTFNGNGGTPSKTSESFIAGETYGDAMPSALRNGYSFDGWYTSASGGTWCGRSTVVQSSVNTLYAHWSKNNTDVLKVNHIYKIYNKKSGLPFQTNGSSAGANVRQQLESSESTQLWRVKYADGDGYYKFESLYGGNALDMDGTNQYGYRNHLQLWTPSESSTQKFSIVKRAESEDGTAYYSIHVKYSGRALDVYDSSTEPGAQIIQWDSHRGDGQLFYFVEQVNREIKLYQNNNGNYLPSPKEVYEEEGTTTPQNCYSSRNPAGVTVTINPTNDSLTIKQITPDNSADMKWVAAMGDSNVYSDYEFDDTTMELKFRAKASVPGAKIWFRWGFDSVETGFYPVTLTTNWANYTLVLPRTRKSGNNLHPYIDKACTVEIEDIALYAEGTEGYIGDTDAYSYQRIPTNVYDSVYLPSFPEEERADGYYQFDGWYTKRIGGIKVSDGDEYYDFSSALGSQCLYAHWMLNTAHMHTYITSVVTPSCESSGYTIHVCETCGASYMTDVISAIGHDYKAIVKEATCTQSGYTTYTCNDCGDTFVGNEVNPLGHNYIETYEPESCTKDGYLKYQCSRCEESFKEIISATGHLDENDDGYCDLCSKELQSHEDLTDPTQPDPPQPQPQTNVCKWCGKQHNGFFQGIIGFFHRILAAIFGAKY